MRNQNRLSYPRLLAHLAVMLFLLTACPPPTPPPPKAHDLNYRLCVAPPVGAIGGPVIPDVNGNVADLGWFGAVRHIFKQTGSTVADAAFQAKHDSDFLYLSVEVKGDNTLDDHDLIILTFDPDGTEANYRRLHIFPLQSGTTGGATGKTPRLVKYWAGYPWGGNIAPPSGVDIQVEYATSSNANDSKWSVEIKLPLADFDIVPTNYFGFYVNVIKVNGADLTAHENPWPSNAVLIGSPFTPEVATPPASSWGNATTGHDACNGVSITSSDIETNHTPSTIISLDEPNYFFVRPRNNSIDSAGNPVAAKDVWATIRLRNFGTGLAEYAPVPVDNPPGTTAPGDIAPNGQGNLQLGPWNLTSAQRQVYGAFPNQCSMVELNSSAPETTFVNKSTYRNFTFLETSSPFVGVERISTIGYELPPGKERHEFILTEYTYNTPPDTPWKSEITGKGLEKLRDRVYLLTVEPNEEVEIQHETAPPAGLKIPNELVDVKPGTGGTVEPIAIEVAPGSLVTLIASGSIQLRQDKEGPLAGLVGPNGRDATAEAASLNYLLGNEQAPYQVVGALVASFDSKFRESGAFVVGESETIKVPDNASTLFLAINDTPEGYEQETGDGFHVQVINTKIEDYFLSTDSMLIRDPFTENFGLPAGANLPKYVLCGKYKRGKILTIEGTDYELVDDTGCVEYIITAIN